MRYALLLLLCACTVRYQVNTNEVAIPILPNVGIHCATGCGLLVTNIQHAEECKYLDEWESAYITAFARAHQNACKAVEGWKVVLVDGENNAFFINHKPVSGSTVCDSKMIFLATKPFGFKSALPHELGHVLDCTNGVPQADSHKHLGWKNKGYCEAIDASSTLHLACEGDQSGN